MIGWQLVTTDGTSSLLGGDDKAGIAMLVSLLARYKDQSRFTPTYCTWCLFLMRRLATGAALFWILTLLVLFMVTPLTVVLLAKFCYETFNAAGGICACSRTFSSYGYRKRSDDQCIRSTMRFHELLPPAERPEFTEG